MAKHREFQKHKGWAFAATAAAFPPCFKHNGTSLRLYCTVHPKTAHAIDEDNAVSALKAYQDGIALAMKTDDSFFKAPSIEFAAPIKGGRFVIRIGEAA